MNLADKGREIDAALREECDKWIASINDLERVIEEQDIILQSDEAKGDRSENAVFQTAADTKQRSIMEKVLLEERVRNFRQGAYAQYNTDDYTPTGIIKVGSVVRFTVPKANREFIVKIVPQHSDAPLKGAASTTSAVGRALLNKKEGDTVECKTERGTWQYVIEEVY